MLKPKNPLVAISEYEECVERKQKPKRKNKNSKQVSSNRPKEPREQTKSDNTTHSLPEGAMKLSGGMELREGRSDHSSRGSNSAVLPKTNGKLSGPNSRIHKTGRNQSLRKEANNTKFLQQYQEKSQYGRKMQANRRKPPAKHNQPGKSKYSAQSETTVKVPSAKKQKDRLKRKMERMRWGLPKKSNDDKTESSKDINTTSAASCFEDLGSFDWNATAKDLAKVVSAQTQQRSESEESDDEVPTKRRKLSKAEKRLKALADEKKLKLKERELLESEENPNSPDHFERLLVGSPDSAELWIKYMGYHAVNADIEKARAVGRRALKRIDPQQTASKLDVWKALLNLEHTFCPLEVFKETFAEALMCNDDYAVNTQVLKLYADSNNVTEVDQLTNIMVKKYRDNVECWLQCQNALMSVGLNEKARNLLQKALAVLTKKNHITLISRFALLENKHGFPEQAQALFENLLTSFPQRLDLLSVYVDMLVKSHHIDIARNVLERAAGNTLPARKMKSIYMKWLAFEEAHGSPSDVSKVEKVAKKYVANIMELPGRKNLKGEEQSEDELEKSVDRDDET